LKKLTIAAVCVVVLVRVAALTAHWPYRIIGTIAKVTEQSLEVQETDGGAIVSMEMNDHTVVTRDKKKLDRTDLKPGLYVVVDANGDSIRKLTIDEVKVVPPPGANKAKQRSR
jgi:hypothetical protein